MKASKSFLRKYSKRININCCRHKGSPIIKYQIGYIGLRCCKVAICLDCEQRQVICRGFAKWLLVHFVQTKTRRINILCVVTNQEMFLYR